MYGFALLFILSFILYFLYINGFCTVSCGTFLFIMGSMGYFRDRCKIKFSHCSGYVKKVIKFKEDKIYKFTFDGEIKTGEVNVQILDRNKKIILELDKSNCIKEHKFFKKERYYLVFNFKKSDGNVILNWI